MDAFCQNMIALVESVEDCLEKGRLLPCLMLLYSGIDVVAGLERESGEGTKAAFVRWVAEYLLKVRLLPCTALELYAARCGIVHAFTPESDLSRQGKARKVFYAWGTAKSDHLALASRALGRNDCVAIHIRELIDAFRDATVRYLNDIANSPERLARIKARTGQWFTHMDQDLLNRFLDVYTGRPPMKGE
jgi:hypothetical protein